MTSMAADKTEVWLKGNRRVLAAALAPPGLVVALGLLLLLAAPAAPARVAGGALVVVAGLVLGVIAWWGRMPRLARAGDELLVNLGASRPVRVPLELVECIFLGRGPLVPAEGDETSQQTKNVVIRLAERATDYAQGQAQPLVGSWCDGYITLRGTWCEPLDLARLTQLNQRLAAARESLAAANGVAAQEPR